MTFDPYSISKFMRYVFSYNDSSEDTIDVIKSLSLVLQDIITQREAALESADLKDPLIDVEMHDLVDIIRTYQVFTVEDPDFAHVPVLFKSQLVPQETSNGQHKLRALAE